MRRAPAAGIALVLALGGCGGDSAATGCAGPRVTVSSPTVAPGSEVDVRAEFLWTDCYDTGQPGTPPPRQDVPIELDPSGEAPAIRLATVDADPDGRIALVVRIPADAPVGPAELVVGEAPIALELTAT